MINIEKKQEKEGRAPYVFPPLVPMSETVGTCVCDLALREPIHSASFRVSLINPLFQPLLASPFHHSLRAVPRQLYL